MDPILLNSKPHLTKNLILQKLSRIKAKWFEIEVQKMPGLDCYYASFSPGEPPGVRAGQLFEPSGVRAGFDEAAIGN